MEITFDFCVHNISSGAVSMLPFPHWFANWRQFGYSKVAGNWDLKSNPAFRHFSSDALLLQSFLQHFSFFLCANPDVFRDWRHFCVNAAHGYNANNVVVITQSDVEFVYDVVVIMTLCVHATSPKGWSVLLSKKSYASNTFFSRF